MSTQQEFDEILAGKEELAKIIARETKRIFPDLANSPAEEDFFKVMDDAVADLTTGLGYTLQDKGAAA